MLIDRFLSNVEIDDETGCWNWTASVRSDGYGQFGRGGRGTGVASAHRASYKLHCGEIPPGMHVLHRCDRKICVNPQHLFLGTSADNMADKVAKGRQPCGENHVGAKLSEANVILIRESKSIPGVTLAKRFGVSQQLISAIRYGKARTTAAMEKR